MGADFTVIKGCNLQTELGDEAFAAAVKRSVQLAGLEARRSEIEAASGRSLEELSVTVTGTNRAPRKTTVAELRADAARLDTSECAACPLAGGAPLGCYRYVTYPVDDRFEELFFEYFVASLESGEREYTIGKQGDGSPVTAAGLLLDHVVRRLEPSAFDAWRTQRGSAVQGGLAARREPLTKTLRSGRELSSALMLAIAFAPAIDGKMALSLYAHLFDGFIRHLSRKGIAIDTTTLREIQSLAALYKTATAEKTVRVHVEA